MPVWHTPIGTRAGSPAVGKILTCVSDDGVGVWSGIGDVLSVGGSAPVGFIPVAIVSALFTNADSAGIYGLGQNTKSKHNSVSGGPIYPMIGAGLSVPILLTTACMVNTIAPGIDVTYAMRPFSIHAASSGSGNIGYSFGSKLATMETTFTSAELTASSIREETTPENPGAPSGSFCMTAELSGTPAAGSVIHLQSALWMKV